MKKLSYDEWEKWFIDTQFNVTEEEIESWKTRYYCGLNTYDEFKSLLKEEYELYLRSVKPHQPNLFQKNSQSQELKGDLL